MVRAYILMSVQPGKERDIYYQVTSLDTVSSAEILYGVYDLLVEVNSKSPEALDEFVFNTLRQIENVKTTTTCICAGLFKR